MALISDLANATPTKSDILEMQRGQTSSNNVSVEQLMQLSAVENLAPAYDATSTYSVGDWCVYEGTLYQCNTDITTAEAFDATKWDAKKIVETTGSDIPVSSSSSETIAEAIVGLTPEAIPNSAFTMSNTSLVANSSFKLGNVVFINIQVNSSQTGTDYTFGTISSEYRPAATSNLLFANANYTSGAAWINTQGYLRAGTSSAITGQNSNIIGFYLI